jgi:outer membrane protein assembly factor BamB
LFVLKNKVKLSITLSILSFIISCSTINKILPFDKPDVKSDKFIIKWNKSFDPEYLTGNLPVNFVSPKIHEDILFLGDPNGVFSAHDLDTGKVIWKVQESVPLGAQASIYKSNVYYGSTTGRLFVRTAFTGKLKYAIDLKASIEQAPVFYKDRLLLQLRNHKVVCLDASTGKILWIYKRSVPYTTTIQRSSGVFVNNEKVFVGFADGFVSVFSIHNGEILWEKKLSSGTKFVDVDATPIIFNGNLIVGSMAGKVHLINANTGQTKSVLNYSISRQPFIHNNLLYISTIDGRLVILDKQYQKVSDIKVSEFPLTTPIIWKNEIAFTDVSGNLYSLDRKKMKVTKLISFGSSNSGHYGYLEVFENYLAMVSSRNRLYVLRK